MSTEELTKEKKAERDTLYLHMLMRLSNLASEIIEIEEIYQGISKYYPYFASTKLRSVLRTTLKQVLPSEFWNDPSLAKEHLDLCQQTFDSCISFFDIFMPALRKIIEEHPNICEDLMQNLHKSIAQDPEHDERGGDSSIIVPDVDDCFPGPEPTKFN